MKIYGNIQEKHVIINNGDKKMENITNRAKKIKTKAHRWKVDSDGEIDFFAMSQDFCNGPLCIDCYASFCVHCLTKNKGENALYKKLAEQKCKEKIFCSSCFKIVSSDDNYCKNCGAKFDE